MSKMTILTEGEEEEGEERGEGGERNLFSIVIQLSF